MAYKRLLDTKTKLITSDAKGAEHLQNEWGSMIKALDFALVNGSDKQDVLSITTIADPEEPDKYWLSTIVLNEDHGFIKEIHVVEISECSEPTYNKEFRVQDVKKNAIVVAFDKTIQTEKPEDIVDANGTKIRLPPLGYNKAFSGENKAVYVNGKDFGNVAYLRVDNSPLEGYDPSWTKYSRVSMFSDMNHIDDYHFRPGRYKSPSYPDNYTAPEERKGPSNGNGYYGVSKWLVNSIYSRSYTDSNGDKYPSRWNIIGDNRTFYFTVEDTWDKNKPVTYSFGEYVSLFDQNNIYNFILCCTHHYCRASDTIYTNSSWQSQGYYYFTRTNTEEGRFTFPFMNDSGSLTSHYPTRFFSNIGAWGSTDSGYSTDCNYDGFHRNYTKVYLKSNFPEFGFQILGVMRGLRFVNNNMRDKSSLRPNNYHVDKDLLSDEYVMYIEQQGPSNGDTGAIAFKLNDWG